MLHTGCPRAVKFVSILKSLSPGIKQTNKKNADRLGSELIQPIQIGRAIYRGVLDCWLGGLNAHHYFCTRCSATAELAGGQQRGRVAVNLN